MPKREMVKDNKITLQDIEKVGFKIVSDHCGLILYKEDCPDGSQVRLNIMISKVPEDFLEVGYAFTIVDKRVPTRISFSGLIKEDFLQTLKTQEKTIRKYILKNIKL